MCKEEEEEEGCQDEGTFGTWLRAVAGRVRETTLNEWGFIGTGKKGGVDGRGEVERMKRSLILVVERLGLPEMKDEQGVGVRKQLVDEDRTKDCGKPGADEDSLGKGMK